MGKKLILLGLDGATWDVLYPLMDKGVMPNLKDSVEDGFSTEMRSTFPPITAPAWLSMATGKNPGKTGVTDFRKAGEDLHERKTVTSSDFRKNGAFWDKLNDHGFKTYLMGFPMVYPYYSLDGIIVGGWGTPDHAELAYPPGLDEEIEDISDGYMNYVPWDSEKYKKDKKKLIEDLSLMLEKQTRVVKELLKDDWDFFTYICSVSDFLQHSFWDDWEDPDSPHHRSFVRLWEEMDELIGYLSKHEDSNLFIVSDHGFGPVKNRFLPSRWLLKQGYLRKKRFSSVRTKAISILRTIHEKMKEHSMYEKIGIDKSKLLDMMGDRGLKRSLNVSLLYPSELDMERSRAVSRSSGIHGEIDVIEGDRELRSKIKESLKELSRAENFDLNIYEKEEIYEGPKMDELPDLIFEIDDYACFVDSSQLDGKIHSQNYEFDLKSGTHREEGIFCATGPEINSADDIEEIDIYDVAPTILHHFDVPVPNDVDGRVLKEIFRKDSKPYQTEVKHSEDSERERLKDAIDEMDL